ncbi:phosphoribosylanthranilate isomerase [Aquirhabdus sp.]|uniref:phosphoribosylanthranilate isomerase n=1 Tax=Aquirhabdus sp. TaxID=2824160 RepID=UPI00396C4151
MSNSSSPFTSTRVKICGLTRIIDVQAVVEAGADAVGFVFYPPSPRAVTAAHAATLIPYVPPFVQAVGLFVNVDAEELQDILSYVSLDLLQFHGDETPEQCQQLGVLTGKRWIKALQMKPDMNIQTEIKRYKDAGASGVLLDAWHPDLHGGTGYAFDWARFPKPEDFETPFALILAGGLTPENVAEAIEQTHAYAVDVSGGVEASKGIKDKQAIEKFVEQAKRPSQHAERWRH